MCDLDPFLSPKDGEKRAGGNRSGLAVWDESLLLEYLNE